MGWLFCADRQHDLIQMLISDEQNSERRLEVIQHQVNKTHQRLWTVTRVTAFSSSEESRTFISCYYMKKEERWGFKRVDEEFHPLSYDCPFGFLTIAKDGINEEWRRKVFAWHLANTMPATKSISVPPIFFTKVLGHKVIESAGPKLLRED